MNLITNTIEEILKKLKKEWFTSLCKGLTYSISLHILLILIIQIILTTNLNTHKKIKLKKLKEFKVQLKKVESEIQEHPALPLVRDSSKILDPIVKNEEKFGGIEIDTSSLINLYKENTLNVSVLFPFNWKFIDNQVNDLIDGILFLPDENSNYDPRLSVTIQVVTNKNLFNPRLYDNSFTYNNMKFFIAKPVKTYEQVTQQVYIRTNLFKADFLIKCTSPNESEFLKFQPTFFAMLKSFSAGY